MEAFALIPSGTGANGGFRQVPFDSIRAGTTRERDCREAP
jgi:hypothetical protein